MKKHLLILLTLLLLSPLALLADTQALTVKGATATMQDGTEIILGTTKQTETSTNFSFSCSKNKYFTEINFPSTPVAPVVKIEPNIGTNTTNSPSYNDDGGLRSYPNNKLKIIGLNGNKITKITFTINNASKYIEPSANVGSLSTQKEGTTVKTTTWEATSAQQSVTITMPSDTGKQFCFTSIEVTYEEGGNVEPPVITLGDIVAKYGDTVINEGDVITVDEGTTFDISAANATKLNIWGVGQSVLTLEPSYTWTPEVCTSSAVKIEATRNDEVKALNFTLTVTEKPIPPLGEGQWVPVTDVRQLADGDIITFTAKEYTGSNTLSSITYPEMVMKEKSSSVINCQPYNYADGAFDVTPYEITLKKNGVNFNMSTVDGYINGATEKKVNFTDAIDSTDPTAYQFTIAIEADGSAKVENVKTSNNTLQYNPNLQNPADYTTARFCFYTSSQQKVYMYKKQTVPMGEISMEHAEHFQLEEYRGEDEIIVMAGTPVTFRCPFAEKMAVTSDDEGFEAVEAAGEEVTLTISEEAIYSITVTATQGDNTKSAEYAISTEVVEPTLPTFEHDADNKYILISCEAGALMVMVEAVPETTLPDQPEEAAGAPRRVAAQDWAHPEGIYPREFEIDYTDHTGTVSISAKAVTPLKQTSSITFSLNETGIVSAITTVEADDNSLSPSLLTVEHFNLQGQRIATPTLPGIYLRRQGTKVEKITVK